MRLARVVRETIAADLHGTLPINGKQFLTTESGVFRLASRGNSDNTTEQAVHQQMGARTVQVFGDLSPTGRAQGWMTVEELYALHRVRLDPQALLQAVADRFRGG